MSDVPPAVIAALLTRIVREAFDGPLETRSAWDEDTLGDAIGAIAHSAYHLGAMRQRLAVQRAD